MAHMVETMAYAGQTPWHGLGTKVEHDMTPEEMLIAAQLNWTVSKRPLYTPSAPNVWNIIDPTGEALFFHLPDDHVLMRDSDNTRLSVCGNDYIPFQNAEVMQFFKKFTDAGNMSIETAGSLRDGKDIWCLAKLDNNFVLPGDDQVGGYLLLNNSHQVGKAMTIMLTPIRVVCNNTLTLALKQGGNKFRVLHIQMFDEQVQAAAEEALGLSNSGLQVFQEQAEFLSKVTAKDQFVDRYVAQLFQPNLLASNDDVAFTRDEFKRTALAVREAIEVSPGADAKSAKGTWWGALNGVTYVLDHQKQSRSAGNGLYSAWLGGAANTKRKALDLALDMAKAA